MYVVRNGSEMLAGISITKQDQDTALKTVWDGTSPLKLRPICVSGQRPGIGSGEKGVDGIGKLALEKCFKLIRPGYEGGLYLERMMGRLSDSSTAVLVLLPKAATLDAIGRLID